MNLTTTTMNQLMPKVDFTPIYNFKNPPCVIENCGSNDPAVKVYDLVLSGSFFTFWRDDLKKPSVTLLGGVCDWIFGIPSLSDKQVDEILGSEQNKPVKERPFVYHGSDVPVITYTVTSMVKICTSTCAMLILCDENK